MCNGKLRKKEKIKINKIIKKSKKNFKNNNKKSKKNLNALSHHCTDAKGVKDVIKQARRAAAKKSGPGGPLDF